MIDIKQDVAPVEVTPIASSAVKQPSVEVRQPVTPSKPVSTPAKLTNMPAALPPKRKVVIEDDSDDDIIVKPAAAKRAKVESEEEWDSESAVSMDSCASSVSYDDEEEEEEEDVVVKPVKKAAKKSPASMLSTPKTPKKALPSPTDITYSASPNCRDASSEEYLSALSNEAPSSGVYAFGQHEHNSWAFYQNLRDAAGVPKGHPDYNPRTWQVPDKVLREQTPAMRQWFDIKMNNFDVVLFFKVMTLL